jgi:proline dehydrogenase
LGIALQAYLKRTQADLLRILRAGGKVRLCKGAYDEPKEIAYKDMSIIRAKYMELMDRLFRSDNYFAIATHDDSLIRRALSYDRDPKTFEFQLLKGVKQELARMLREEGYRVSIYLPYGPEWLPYSIRRVRERKGNLLLLAKALISG